MKSDSDGGEATLVSMSNIEQTATAKHRSAKTAFFEELSSLTPLVVRDFPLREQDAE